MFVIRQPPEQSAQLRNLHNGRILWLDRWINELLGNLLNGSMFSWRQLVSTQLPKYATQKSIQSVQVCDEADALTGYSETYSVCPCFNVSGYIFMIPQNLLSLDHICNYAAMLTVCAETCSVGPSLWLASHPKRLHTGSKVSTILENLIQFRGEEPIKFDCPCWLIILNQIMKLTNHTMYTAYHDFVWILDWIMCFNTPPHIMVIP